MQRVHNSNIFNLFFLFSEFFETVELFNIHLFYLSISFYLFNKHTIENK